MRAMGLLMILVAIWIVVNAVNIRELMQGRLEFNRVQLPNSNGTTK